jgi:hypothetical protein
VDFGIRLGNSNMPIKNFILFICLAFPYFPAHTQKKIVAETKGKEITIKKGLDGNNFYITLTVVNNTDDSLKIPPVNSDLCHVLIKIPPHNEYYYIDKVTCDGIIGFGFRNQVIAPKSKGNVKLGVFGFLFSKKGRNKVRFYPIITNYKDDKKIWVRSNKVIVNVE